MNEETINALRAAIRAGMIDLCVELIGENLYFCWHQLFYVDLVISQHDERTWLDAVQLCHHLNINTFCGHLPECPYLHIRKSH